MRNNLHTYYAAAGETKNFWINSGAVEHHQQKAK